MLENELESVELPVDVAVVLAVVASDDVNVVTVQSIKVP